MGVFVGEFIQQVLRTGDQRPAVIEMIGGSNVDQELTARIMLSLAKLEPKIILAAELFMYLPKNTKHISAVERREQLEGRAATGSFRYFLY